MSLAPQTHRAVIHTSPKEPLTVQDVSVPDAGPGSAVVEILATPLFSYTAEVINGTRPYPMVYPLTPGASAIGRVRVLGPDAVSLRPGDLVLCDMFVTARDDPSVSMLIGVNSNPPKAEPLMEHEWRNSTWAERARFPLENLLLLDEDELLKRQGYSIHDLCTLPTAVVPFGGLDEIGLRAGETIIIAPATGSFGGSAVSVALAMGARVIAMGRNANILTKLATTYAGTRRLQTVTMSGTLEGDRAALQSLFSSKSSSSPSAAGADCILDLSPPSAANNTYIPAAFSVLKHGGRVALMGGILGGMEMPYRDIMRRNIRVQGKWMYTREQAVRCIKMAEAGLLPLGRKEGTHIQGVYGLEQIQEGMDRAATCGWGEQVLVVPRKGGD